MSGQLGAWLAPFSVDCCVFSRQITGNSFFRSAPMASPHLLQDLHQRAIELYAQGKLEEAAQFLSDSIAEKQTSELWNDWAAVQARLGNFLDSERGFRCALRLNEGNAQAAENLGALLFSQRRFPEAGVWLRRALELDGCSNHAALEEMFSQCGEAHQEELREFSQTSSSDGETRDIHKLGHQEEQSTHSPNDSHAKFALSSQGAATVANTAASYEDWFETVFGQRVATPGVRLATSWPEDSEWGRRAHNALVQVECDYVRHLLAEITEKQIPGNIAEFGIFEGWWIDYLWHATENLG
jgi:tetratricopeptide (TPR) repeat protein